MRIFNSVSILQIRIFGWIFSIVFGVPLFVNAYVPSIIVQDSLKDIEVIADPELSQMFHGELIGFPHTYEIRVTKPFILFTQILQPDIDSSKNNISGIIIKDQGRGSRVEKVARLEAENASWEMLYESWSGGRYRTGSSFEKELGPGVYRIEVHTPNNLDKYVLVIGKRDEMTLGYFELLGKIAEVKVFFGKSKFQIIESPLVYGPLLVLGMVIAYGVYRKRQKENFV